jgi:hypothetical protein
MVFRILAGKVETALLPSPQKIERAVKTSSLYGFPLHAREEKAKPRTRGGSKDREDDMASQKTLQQMDAPHAPSGLHRTRWSGIQDGVPPPDSLTDRR